jgi:adenosine deaminase
VTVNAAAAVAEIARGGLAELHTHLGAAVDSARMWEIAHEQGIALPSKDYWDFHELVTITDPHGVPDLEALDAIYHWTELIQSSPEAVEMSVHGAIGGAYRSQNITTLELRFNPMKRNRGGERDLDHILLAATHGLDRASLEYPQVRAGLIVMMDRTFSYEQNEIIVDKALRYASRGVVGIDIAGPRPGGARYDYLALAPLFERARSGGLGLTVHCGEEGGELGIEELEEVLRHIRPQRIGHGILASREPRLVELVAESGTVLEISPTSNLLTQALASDEELARTLRTFAEGGVRFTIATDGPEMMNTRLQHELELVIAIGALTPDEAAAANRTGHEASFLAAG